MATRSTISIQTNDGSVYKVYCHWDGYLSNNGVLLRDFWNTPEKVMELVQHGDLSSLGSVIGEKHSFSNPYKYGTSEYFEWNTCHQKMCTFYGRDREETGVDVKVYEDFADYLKNCQFEEFDYIMRNGTWYVLMGEGEEFQLLSEAIELETADD